MGARGQSISEIKSEAAHTQQEINILRQKVEHQNHLLKGMWKIIKEKMNLNDKALEDIVRDIVEEEAVAPEIAECCPECSRPLQANTSICIYCGAETNHQHLF